MGRFPRGLRVSVIAGGAAAALLLAGEAAAAACDRERREVSSAEAMVSMTEFEVAERRRTVAYADETSRLARDVDYTPPDWLRSESLAQLARMEVELDRRKAALSTARSNLSSCLTWAWRDSGSPRSGGPVAGYVPRGEPGRSALRGDMVGDYSPGGSSRPYRRPDRYRDRGPLGADPRDARAWRGDNGRADSRRDRADNRRDRSDDRRDRSDNRRDRKRDARGDRRRSGSDRGPHRAPDTPFYDPPL